MRDVYRRYFKVESGPMIDAIKEAQKVNMEARAQYAEICAEIGAENEYWQLRGRLTGFQFKNEPDKKTFKPGIGGNGWYPKKNISAGKELVKRLSAIKTVDMYSTLRAVGLNDGPRIIDSRRVYYVSMAVIPSEKPVVFISVPWFDEDPQILKAYKDGRRDRIEYNSSSLDSIIWEPTEDMIPVKGWEVQKAIDEWNERHAA